MSEIQPFIKSTQFVPKALTPDSSFLSIVVQDAGFQPTVRIQNTDYLAEAYTVSGPSW